MFPIRWRIFYIASYIFCILAFITDIYFISLVVNLTIYAPDQFIFIFSLLFILTGFTYSNAVGIYLVAKFFPFKSLTRFANRWRVSSIIIFILALIDMCVLFYVVFINAAASEGGIQISDIIPIVILCVIFLSQFNMLLMHIRLRKLLEKNNQRSVENLIRSIGKNDQ